jgi:hypothetical protein
MSKQVLFYLTPKDARKLETDLRAKNEFELFEHYGPKKAPTPVSSLAEVDGAFRLVVAQKGKRPSVVYEIPAQSRWSVDVQRSNVIDFDGCYYDKKVLRRGRLYLVTGYYDDRDEWKDKPADFLSWANAILTTAKKSLKKHPDLDAYAGEEVWSWGARAKKICSVL